MESNSESNNMTTMGSVAQVVKSVGPKMVPFFKTVAIYFVIFPPSNVPTVFSTILKCLPILSLMLFVVLYSFAEKEDEKKYARRILMGLIFCCFGDAFLVWPHFFEVGMLAFAMGHINYIAGFGFEPLNLKLGLVLYSISFGVIAVLLPGMDALMIPGVLIYTFLITTMLWRALARVQFSEDAGTWSKMCSGAGGVLFVLSDSVLALNKFNSPIDHQQLIVMSTYYAAQFGITLSIVDAKPQPTSSN